MVEDAKVLFERLARGGRRTFRAAPEPPPPEPSPDERLAGACSQWANTAPSEFLSWLDEQIASANDSSHRRITEHAATAYAAGQEIAWRQLQRKFTEWKGQAAD